MKKEIFLHLQDGRVVDERGRDLGDKLTEAQALLNAYRIVEGRSRGGRASTQKKRDAAKLREAKKREQRLLSKVVPVKRLRK